MPKYRFSRSARAEVAAIISYTEEHWGSRQAETYIDEMQALCARLAEYPHIGKAADDLAAGLRWIPYESHVIFYTPEPGGVVIESVLHGRQDPTRRFKSEG